MILATLWGGCESGAGVLQPPVEMNGIKKSTYSPHHALHHS